MKKSILYFSIILLVSCNSPLDKSIFEPLSVDEVKEVILTQDSVFIAMYELLESGMKSENFSNLEKAHWENITYRKLLDLIEFQQDTNIEISIKNDIDTKWKENNEKYEEFADSIIEFWDKKMKKSKTGNSDWFNSSIGMPRNVRSYYRHTETGVFKHTYDKEFNSRMLNFYRREIIEEQFPEYKSNKELYNQKYDSLISASFPELEEFMEAMLEKEKTIRIFN